MKAADKQQLPSSLIWSVLGACHLSPKIRSSTDINSVTCLSKDVQDLLKEKQADPQKLDDVASLLRLLINFYRGDVTLTLSAYPHAAVDTYHHSFTSAAASLSTASLLVERGDMPQAYTPSVDRKSSLHFTRTALSIYQQLAHEKTK